MNRNWFGLWSYSPLNIEHSHFCHVSWKLFEILLWNFSQCKSPWDKLQNTKTITLVYLLLELQLIEHSIENSHFYYILVYALYFHETSHKCKALWDDLQNTWIVTLVCLGVVGWCEGAKVLCILHHGRPTDIGLQLGKACYPCSG